MPSFCSRRFLVEKPAPEPELFPLACPTLFAKEEAFSGNAKTTLAWREAGLPPGLQTEAELSVSPGNISIPGYSLAGLFSLCPFYKNRFFSSAASGGVLQRLNKSFGRYPRFVR